MSFPSPAEDYHVRPLDISDIFPKGPYVFYFKASCNFKRIEADDYLVVDRSVQPEIGSYILDENMKMTIFDEETQKIWGVITHAVKNLSSRRL